MFTEIHHQEIDSTHLYALREKDELLPESYVITADHQSNGIGTKEGRVWNSAAKKSLLASFLFSDEKGHSAQNYAQLLAHCVMDVLEMLEFKPTFKWPNDILLNNKKVGGAMVSISGSAVVASVGLNVNMENEDFGQVDYPATSLKIESGGLADLELVEQLVITVFTRQLTAFLEEGFTPFRKVFESRLAYVGQRVNVDSQEGVVKGLAEDGRLILEVDGKDKQIASGTLRPVL